MVIQVLWECVCFHFICQVKEVAPKTGTAVTSSFWKVDLKKTRSILHKHREYSEQVEEEVIEEWSVSVLRRYS